MITNKRKSRRRSLQRDLIREIVNEAKSHPTALQVYDKLRLRQPRASLGNVYRNIRILVEQGQLASRDFGDGAEHFDACTDDHCHFVCDRCGRVSDFEMPLDKGLAERAGRLTDHEIRGHTVQFHGVCSDCRRGDARVNKKAAKNIKH